MADTDFDDKDARTVFCGNVSESATEEILYELFIQGGPVDNISLPKDKEGRQRTFCFVTYAHSVSVPYAVELFQGTRLFNRDLTIKVRNGAAGGSNNVGNQPLPQHQQQQQQHRQQNPFGSQPHNQVHHQHNRYGPMMGPAQATALVSGFNNMAQGGIHMGPIKNSRERIAQPLTGETADINALLMMASQLMQPGGGGQTDGKSSSRNDNRSGQRDRPYNSGGHRRNRSPDYRQHDNRTNNNRQNHRSGGGGGGGSSSHGGRRR